MIRDLLMHAIPFEVRAHHGRFVTPLERETADSLKDRKTIRSAYSKAQVR